MVLNSGDGEEGGRGEGEEGEDGGLEVHGGALVL